MTAELKLQNDALCVCGDLDFSSVMSIYQDSLKLFSAAQSSIVIDFSGVKSANSAALAVIINWMMLAKKNNKAIHFKNLSADILSLAKVSGLDKVIAPVMA